MAIKILSAINSYLEKMAFYSCFEERERENDEQKTAESVSIFMCFSGGGDLHLFCYTFRKRSKET